MHRVSRTGVSILVLLGMSMPASSFAQRGSSKEPVLMPELPVSATRLGLRLDEVAASTERLGRAEIEALAPATTAELIRGMSGVQVDGGGAGPAYLHVRGADPNLTLVLVDGVAVNDPTDARGGAFDLRDLDPSEIESIEVVRGPVSAVHGSDAMAGVIQIVTRRAGDRAWGRVALGDFDYRALAAGAGGNGETSAWDLRAHHRDEASDVAGQERRSRGAGGRGELRFGRRTSLQWSLNASSTHELHYRDDSGGLRFGTSGELESQVTDRRQAMVQLDLPIGSALRGKWRLSALDLDRSLDSPAIGPGVRAPVPATTSDDELRRRNLGFDLHWRRSPRQVAVIGADVEFEDGNSRGTLDQGFVVPTNFDRTRRTAGFFVEASRTTAGNLTVESALRWDAIEDFAPELTPRIGMAWWPTKHRLRIHASWAQGFKAPSFFAVSHPLVGNPALDPERSENYEAGLTYRSKSRGWEAGVVGFVTDYTDLIDFDSTIFRMVNRDAVDAHGIELRGKLVWGSGWSASGQVQYTHQRIRGLGVPLQDRPEWTSTLDLGRQWSERGGIVLRLFHQGRVPDSSIPTGDRERKAFLRFDLSATRNLQRGLQLVATVENLFDEAYEETIGIPGRGRFARLGIRVER